MATLTSANATIFLAVAGLFPTPQQLQGFAADDVFSSEKLNSAELSMGVDGRLSAGFVFVAAKWSVTLQADSESNFIFDQWYQAQQVGRELLPASGIVLLQTLNTKWTMTRGFLTGYTPIPDTKKKIEPRNFEMTWQSIVPSAT